MSKVKRGRSTKKLKEAEEEKGSPDGALEAGSRAIVVVAAAVAAGGQRQQ